MDFLQRMQQNTPYCSRYTDMPSQLQQKAKTLCWQYNQTGPHQQQERAQLLQELLGSCHPLTFIEPSFRCDYGFNIHTHGLTVINYNCVILDTSPVNIGANAFIAPASALPARDMRSTHSSAQRASAPRRPSHWRKMCGLEQTAWSAAE